MGIAVMWVAVVALFIANMGLAAKVWRLGRRVSCFESPAAGLRDVQDAVMEAAHAAAEEESQRMDHQFRAHVAALREQRDWLMGNSRAPSSE